MAGKAYLIPKYHLFLGNWQLVQKTQIITVAFPCAVRVNLLPAPIRKQCVSLITLVTKCSISTPCLTILPPLRPGRSRDKATGVRSGFWKWEECKFWESISNPYPTSSRHLPLPAPSFGLCLKLLPPHARWKSLGCWVLSCAGQPRVGQTWWAWGCAAGLRWGLSSPCFFLPAWR